MDNNLVLGDLSRPTWDENDIASVLRLSVQTVGRKTSTAPGDLPPSIKIGKKHLWLPSTVITWLQSNQGVGIKSGQIEVRNKGVSGGNLVIKRGRGRPRKIKGDIKCGGAQ